MSSEHEKLDAFREGAAFYDALFDPVARLEREKLLLLCLLENVPDERVLDLACGTGHHARFLAEAGAEVTGCDLSDGMIAYAAAQHRHAGLKFQQADMRAPLPGPWDLVICVGNSLSLLPDAAAVAETFRAVAEVLAPGGCFFVQVLNYGHASQQSPKHKVFNKRLPDGTEITAVKNLVPQGDRTLLSLSFFAECDGAYRSVAESAVLLHPGLEELTAAARDAGLEVEAVYGGYDEAPFDGEGSTDLLGVFRKA